MRCATAVDTSLGHTLDVQLNQALRPMRRVSRPTGHLGLASTSIPAFVPWPVALPSAQERVQILGPDGSPIRATPTPSWKCVKRRSVRVDFPVTAGWTMDLIPHLVTSRIPAVVDPSVTGLEASEFGRSSRALKASSISRLIRMVRDWNAAPRRIAPESRPVSPAAHFRAQILAADHRLLSRGPEKDLWHWFLDWREEALRAEDSDLSATRLLKLLRRTLSRLRSGRRPSSPVRRPPTSGDRLRRLADTIVGHAPPVAAPLNGFRRPTAG
jgi:hypothetical protein